MDIPESDSKAVADMQMAVMFKNDGSMTYNSKKTTFAKLKSSIKKSKAKMENPKNGTVFIIAEIGGVPFEKLQKVMKIANSLNLKAVVATKPRN